MRFFKINADDVFGGESNSRCKSLVLKFIAHQPAGGEWKVTRPMNVIKSPKKVIVIVNKLTIHSFKENSAKNRQVNKEIAAGVNKIPKWEQSQL